MLQTVLFWIMMSDVKFFSGAIHSLLPSDGPTPICHLSSCVRGWSTKHNEEHPAAYWSSTDSAHDQPKESGFILIVTEIFPRGIFHVVYHISVFGFMNANCWRGKWSHWDELGSKNRSLSNGNSPVPLLPGNGRKKREIDLLENAISEEIISDPKKIKTHLDKGLSSNFGWCLKYIDFMKTICTECYFFFVLQKE